MIGLEMIAACAPNVAPVTMEKIIQVESTGNPLALNVNPKWVIERDANGQPVMEQGADGQPKAKRRQIRFRTPIEVKTVQDAVTVAYAAIAAGYSVDMGYTQVNSRNLQALGYSVEEMFDGCKNLTAGSRVLTAFYVNALKQQPEPQAALRAALSAYNTGDFNKGFLNGYLARYGIGQPAPVSVPALNSYTADTVVYVRKQPKKDEAMNSNEDASSTQQIADTAPASTPKVVPVVSQSQNDGGTPGVQVEHTAEQAEANGAFHETAMSEGEAWESNADLAGDPDGTAILVNRKRVVQTVKRETSDLANTSPSDADTITANTNTRIPLKGGNGQ
ncbi:lytic transglycosylase domain-containing protein [Pseudomonas oryzihabitans]|uniref:lytic transglycosylase domain-containing protein n=1 Tax=Pseudomonas oryzihabitans TaxID=47885 RepID=UPI0009E3A0A4|nr:lytic transglycosylase domain-containing protein [Pseudomonas oryzihabitans]